MLYHGNLDYFLNSAGDKYTRLTSTSALRLLTILSVWFLPSWGRKSVNWFSSIRVGTFLKNVGSGQHCQLLQFLKLDYTFKDKPGADWSCGVIDNRKILNFVIKYLCENKKELPAPPWPWQILAKVALVKHFSLMVITFTCSSAIEYVVFVSLIVPDFSISVHSSLCIYIFFSLNLNPLFSLSVSQGIG